MSAHVIDLAGCAAAPLERVGGKAHGLGRLIERSLEVPPGFVVTTDAYRSFVEQTGLDREIARLVSGAEDVAGVQQAAVAVADLFAAAPLESAEISTPPMHGSAAVRSRSARAPRPRMAPTPRTPERRTPTSGCAARARCGGTSLRARQPPQRSGDQLPPSRRRRRRAGDGGRGPGDGGRRGGGRDVHDRSVTGDPSQITIESTLGLGLPLVGGEVTPDRYCVDKVTLEIRSRTIASSRSPIDRRRAPRSGRSVARSTATRRRRARSATTRCSRSHGSDASSSRRSTGRSTSSGRWATAPAVPRTHPPPPGTPGDCLRVRRHKAPCDRARCSTGLRRAFRRRVDESRRLT